MIDGTGREFNDHLTEFLQWYLENPQKLYTPLENSIHFTGPAGTDARGELKDETSGIQHGVSAVTIYRDDPFQVQLFIASPNLFIPPHKHPNVDSYEVALRGMEFNLHGETILPLYWCMKGHENSNLPFEWYNTIRVLPDSSHSAQAASDGGAFLSVQQWLNGVKPSSVGDDWSKVDDEPK